MFGAALVFIRDFKYIFTFIRCSLESALWCWFGIVSLGSRSDFFFGEIELGTIFYEPHPNGQPCNVNLLMLLVGENIYRFGKMVGLPFSRWTNKNRLPKHVFT